MKPPSLTKAPRVKSAFYFICGRTNKKMDADYELEHPAIRKLLRTIHARGHEVGLHPSYNTFDNSEALKGEADRLWKVCAEEGIRQHAWGGRMHYLRWRQPTTLRAWADAGMSYDSTLSYADHAGFRCGTCFEYPGFDPIEAEKVSVRVRPLIAMEGSVLNSRYMGLAHDEALALFRDLKEKCRKVKGQFTLLWHNSEMLEHKSIYKEIISSEK